MTSQYNIKDLKKMAKRVARSKRVELHVAQKEVAQLLGFSHWYALAAEFKKGWRPSDEQIAIAQMHLDQINPSGQQKFDEFSGGLHDFGDPGGESAGFIGEHPYRIDVEMDDVFMYGKGWLVHVREAPLSKPSVQVTDKRFKNNPIRDRTFVNAALKIANAKAEQVRARIASDWPRRSTKPDAKGIAVHPINGQEADRWYCLHCDAELRSAAVARNLWHCPECGASPIDIFSEPFGLGEHAPEEGLRS